MERVPAPFRRSESAAVVCEGAADVHPAECRGRLGISRLPFTLRDHSDHEKVIGEAGMCRLKAFDQRLFWLRAILLAVYFVLGHPLLSSGAVHQDNPHKTAGGEAHDVADSDSQAAAAKETMLLSNTRQLTFDGRRAGEGYFSQDGSQLVFQSEREPGNPFFQIYVMDFETGDIQRVSPGRGKTTCAWIHPDGDKVLFASTHNDDSAVEKQRAEIELRQSGNQRRYSWDYD
jgi:hypothetical protein